MTSDSVLRIGTLKPLVRVLPTTPREPHRSRPLVDFALSAEGARQERGRQTATQRVVLVLLVVVLAGSHITSSRAINRAPKRSI